MARKQESPMGEETNKQPSASRQRKFRLIKKSGGKSSESDGLPSESTKTHASTIEVSEQKALPTSEDLHSLIAIRAHQLYQRRGAHHGHDWADWFEARRQVTSEE
ncbi:DUF2934 domain-containing protein [Nitrospira sp. M1]